jgi:hypothetical protein
LIPYLLKLSSSEIEQEILMASFRKAVWIARGASVASGLSALLAASAALASQGPGTGVGTASSFIQVTMAVLVYGTAALVVCVGLIGAVRRH